MNWRSKVLAGLLLMVLSGVAFAQQANPLRTTAVTVEVQRALDELLGQYQTYLQAQGHSGDMQCDPAEVWTFPGRLEAAAKWVGALIGKRGYAFTSEDQLKYSYAFTATSSLPGHETEIVFGGLIVRKKDTLVFLERCKPQSDP